MKKIQYLLAALCAIVFSSNLQAQTPCYAGEITGISVSSDSQCESVEWWLNNNVYFSAQIAGSKVGTYTWKYRKDSTKAWINLPAGWNISQNSIINQFFTYSNNGEYRVIFKETGTNCRDTAYSSFYALKAPKASINFTYTCYGGVLVAKDLRNPSGAGNSYHWGDFSAPSVNNDSILYNCPCTWWIIPLGSFVHITDSLGCVGKAELFGSIFNSQPATYSITTSQNPIGPGQSTVLTANSNYAVSNYKWYRAGNPTVLGTLQDYTVNYIDAGQYRVRIKNTTAAGGCITNKYKTILTTPSNRFEDGTDYDAQLNVYPNPASSEITVGGHEGLIEIFDMSGRLLLSKQEQNPISQINIESLSSGIYILKSGEQMMKMVVGH